MSSPKQVFTVSMSFETVQRIREYAKNGKFRNKSHLVEEAILKFMEVAE
jgi:Arc/MetJ-type ribon-helix-helix transcriptional regulator